MIVYSLKVKNDIFCPKEDNEELLDPEIPYLSVISVLIYLANYTWPNIVFLINWLVRYSYAPTQRHWNKVNHVLQ